MPERLPHEWTSSKCPQREDSIRRNDQPVFLVYPDVTQSAVRCNSINTGAKTTKQQPEPVP